MLNLLYGVLESKSRLAAVAMGLDPGIGLLHVDARFSWQRVLELCSWVVSQPVVIPGRTGIIETKDPDWMWTLVASVSFIGEGFKSKVIPFPLREAVWNVIEGLSKAEEPSRGDFDYRNA